MKTFNAFWQKLLGGLIGPHNLKDELRKQRIEDYGDDTSTERFFGQIVDGPQWIAPKRIAAGPTFMTSDMMLRYHQRANWNNTDSKIQLFAAYLIEALRRRNIPMYAHTAFRDELTQNKHKANGTSRLSYPEAPHCKGKAVDIVHGKYHWGLTRQEWAMIGKIGKDIAQKLNLDITWGGDWKFYDPAHWELKGWKAAEPPQDPVQDDQIDPGKDQIVPETDT